jgi:YbgC/YbaW family acyl-CoA thioester hydrolase
MSSPLFAAPCNVRFQDIDAAGIVFFARVFDYFHDAYAQHLEAQGIRLSEVLADRRWGAPLVHAEADYGKPLRFGGSYVVELTDASPRDTALTVHYQIRSASDATVAHCRGFTTHVFIDMDTKKPRPIPDEIRAAFKKKREG